MNLIGIWSDNARKTHNYRLPHDPRDGFAEAVAELSVSDPRLVGPAFEHALQELSRAQFTSPSTTSNQEENVVTPPCPGEGSGAYMQKATSPQC